MLPFKHQNKGSFLKNVAIFISYKMATGNPYFTRFGPTNIFSRKTCNYFCYERPALVRYIVKLTTRKASQYHHTILHISRHLEKLGKQSSIIFHEFLNDKTPHLNCIANQEFSFHYTQQFLITTRDLIYVLRKSILGSQQMFGARVVSIFIFTLN